MDKREEVKKSVMTSMRRLGSLYVHFKDTENELGSYVESYGYSLDMYVPSQEF